LTVNCDPPVNSIENWIGTDQRHERCADHEGCGDDEPQAATSDEGNEVLPV
jgi:hypothetical protein